MTSASNVFMPLPYDDDPEPSWGTWRVGGDASTHIVCPECGLRFTIDRREIVATAKYKYTPRLCACPGCKFARAYRLYPKG